MEPVHGHSTSQAARTAATQKSFLPEVPQGTARMGPAYAARLQRPAWFPPRPCGAAEGRDTAMPSPRGCGTLKSRTDMRMHAPMRPGAQPRPAGKAAQPQRRRCQHGSPRARTPARASRYCERARRVAPPPAGCRPQPTASPAKPCALCASGAPPPSNALPPRGCRRARCVTPPPAGCEARPAAAAAPRRRPCGHLIKKAPSARARPRGVSSNRGAAESRDAATLEPARHSSSDRTDPPGSPLADGRAAQRGRDWQQSGVCGAGANAEHVLNSTRRWSVRTDRPWRWSR